jgi:hypothetical protein
MSACRLSEPADVELPTGLAGGFVTGVTSEDELLVNTGKVPGVADTLSVWSPGTGKVTTIVHREPPKSIEQATSQIGGASGDGRWIAWEETGFTLEHANWTMWAADRTTGSIFRIGSFEPGADGTAPAGFASDISVEGDRAAWSAPVEIRPGQLLPRIYAADLGTRKMQRLPATAAWPSLVGGVIHAVEAFKVAGPDTLARPVTILADGSTEPVSSVSPAIVMSYAAGDAGSIELTYDQPATEALPNPSTSAVTVDASGRVRAYPMEAGTGQAKAGDGFLAWSDQQNLWVLLDGAATPQLLEHDVDGIGLYAAGRTLLWTHGLDNTRRAVTVDCG